MFLCFAEFGDDHAGEESMQAFAAGKLVGVAPYANQVCAVSAEGIGVVVIDDEPVEAVAVFMLPGIEPLRASVPEKQNALPGG